MPTDGTLPAETRLGRTALRVADLAATTDFYREVVGLTLLERSAERTTLGAGDTPLLVLERDETAVEPSRSAAGLFHTAFRVPSRGALGDALTRVRERGHLDGASNHGVSEALYLTDPEGNGVEIYRDFPRAEWPTSDDGRVRMWTEPLDIEGVSEAATGMDGVPDGTDLGHVHLEVTSLAAFRECYVDTLGFTEQTTLPDASFVAAGGYHHHVGANTWGQRSAPASGRGLAWFEVLLPDTRTLEAVENRVAASQYSATQTAASLSVTGPDDIEVRFRVTS
ncbi:Catechol-23-dioxygenase protein [Halorhabdus tiamatea SARL4B]|uniref:Catechol-23-dioxygenase protein n=1 Tax=Halorhabdus tiamatea SARL4B TaxID=1033806 RepID=F7PKJ1_9EURY|nr:VOC family protein [Halorhabdus tiamatea]ERJ05992.1 Catechol-23-dioxygenase protein [Halorhabdus tiamatea SARL4B]CCQ33975.1 glyoxalase [Halorhabdus tiamatea SARL4B]